MEPIILLRKEFDQGEGDIIKQYLPMVHYRSEIPKNSLVVGRYACLPYYRELEQDIKNMGSQLINSYQQHAYIANFDYYYDIEDYTFKTWFRFQDIPNTYREGAFVVKGRTNSKKLQWKTHMFCENYAKAVNLSLDLLNDPLIGEQGVIIRQYEPLETFEIGLNDLPMTNEWRLFFYQEELLSYGYYWAIIDDLEKVQKATADFEQTGIPFAKKIASILKNNTNFFVIDIAKTMAGEWKVVEVNDGQQSGLNEFNDPHILYTNLSKILKENK